MNFEFRRRPRIQIDLDQPSVYTYTTGDRIDGTVSVSVDHDVSFDEMEITFEGKLAQDLTDHSVRTQWLMNENKQGQPKPPWSGPPCLAKPALSRPS